MHQCAAYQLLDRQFQVQKDVGAIDVVVCVAVPDPCCVLRCYVHSNGDISCLCLTCVFSYNATTASFPSYDDVPLQSIIDAAMVNQASLWAAYYAVSPSFGTFLDVGCRFHFDDF